MLKPGIRDIFALVAVFIFSITTGCATVKDQRVDILYQSAANANGGSGDIHLVEESPPPTGGATTIQWVFGGITNKDGENLGKIVTDTAPTDTLMGAFVQEFKAAGYNTIQEGSIPKDAAKGMVLKSATIRVDEVKSPLSDEAKCKVKIAVEPWRDGKAITKLEYEADYTDSAVTGRDVLMSNTLLRTIQIIMKRSVPEIVNMIEKR